MVSYEDLREQLRLANIDNANTAAELAQVWAERDQLKKDIAEVLASEQRQYVAKQQAEAERDALKAAIADVRRLCEMTIATSCRVQAIDQATDTLAVLDRALAVPESNEDAEEATGS